MEKLNTQVTDQMNFFQGNDPFTLVSQYGSPLYVYNERIFRERCRQMKNLVSYPKFRVNFSVKANSNLALLQIAHEEGIDADAMSPGEIHAELMAGFAPSQIFFISNNVSAEEMRYGVEKGVTISVDSLSQLEQYGKVNPGGKIAVRFNPGVGAGHHEKVVTGGKKTKFGVNPEYIDQVKALLKQYGLKLVGINQHIGSLFMEGSAYVAAAQSLLSIARQFEDLEFVDLGGGFGIPYEKQAGQKPIDLKEIGEKLDVFFADFSKEYGKQLLFKIEPGRFIAAECSVLLGSVHAVKYNTENKYIGTDLGFNVLARPVMYDSYHGIEVYGKSGRPATSKNEVVSVVGNICESGDILAKERLLPEIYEGDLLGVLDAGAYGFTMASNYNNRLRPAEVLIRQDGKAVLTRERDTIEDLMKPYRQLI